MKSRPWKRWHWERCLTGSLLILLVTHISAAAPGPAATSPAEADEDFPFVGEYVGTLQSRMLGRLVDTRVGLQVVSRGEGRFEAVEYWGGLPGAGWDGELKAVLPGRREGRTVRVDALPVGIELDGIVGRVGKPGDMVQGTLRRILRASPTLGRRPPAGAIVLFDGSSTGEFTKATMSEEGLLSQGAMTRDAWNDFTLHVEFRLPYMPGSKDQARANSGVYIQQRYEVQILDSFGDDPVFNGAAALYRQRPADLNMSLPPLVWQAYDLRFRGARFEEGKKVENAQLTLWHNGVKVQDAVSIPTKTGAGKPEGPEALPILFQDHGNPVRFRNIWLFDNAQHPGRDVTPRIVPNLEHT